jgi:hypothetical protein
VQSIRRALKLNEEWVKAKQFQKVSLRPHLSFPLFSHSFSSPRSLLSFLTPSSSFLLLSTQERKSGWKSLDEISSISSVAAPLPAPPDAQAELDLRQLKQQLDDDQKRQMEQEQKIKSVLRSIEEEKTKM